MSTDIPRAGSTLADDAASFRPGANPDRLIDQTADTYRERPYAVLRELLQNALDAMRDIEPSARFIEVGVLSDGKEDKPNQFHLVIRDAGTGMSERTFKEAVGVLGTTTKLSGDYLGQFGVGFYATEAIAHEVIVITKAIDSELTAWRYTPKEKVFTRLEEEKLEKLLLSDFQRHPRPALIRDVGTSIYLRLDIDSNSECREWLSASSLMPTIRRSGMILDSQLFIADYSNSKQGASIFDFQGRDLSGVSLSIGSPPWAVTAIDQANAVERLFNLLLPYTEVKDHPSDWYAFHHQVEDGYVSGFLYLLDPRTPGALEVFLKTMKVETAKDIKQPGVMGPVFGLIDITPGNKLNAKVTAARDHIIRNPAYQKICETVEDACIELYQERGKNLMSALHRVLQAASQPELAGEFHRQMNKSVFYGVLCTISSTYTSLLQDIPAMLNKLVTAAGAGDVLKNAILEFVKLCKPQSGISYENLSTTLQAMQVSADQAYNKERITQAVHREAPTWNPRASLNFFEKVGPYIPFMIHKREARPSGQGGGFYSGLVPLAAIGLLDSTSVASLKVLTKGNPHDFLIRNKSVSLVVQPRSDMDLIVLCHVCNTCFPNRKIEFISFERDLFQEMTTRDEWEPLVQLFQQMITQNHEREGARVPAKVEARGYDPDFFPLLSHFEDGNQIFVLNGYNDLMRDLKDSYRAGLEHGDIEIVRFIGQVLHELYHHVASAASGARSAEERHVVSSRNEMLRTALLISGKYTDLKMKG